MSKKRISSRKVSDIAERRMSVLFGLSVKAAENGDAERAKRYIALARRISQRTVTPMPKENMYCKKCNMPLSIGRNCRVRVLGGTVRITCLECGDVRRVPYARS